MADGLQPLLYKMMMMMMIQVKVNKVEFTLEQAIKAQTGSKSTALLFLQPQR
jgi:hypothetical protein